MSKLDEFDTAPNLVVKTSLPMRLRAWQISGDSRTFAYGGQEVDLSVWDCERAFQGNGDARVSEISPVTKKRKRDAELFPGEIWRAENVRELRA